MSEFVYPNGIFIEEHFLNKLNNMPAEFRFFSDFEIGIIP